MGGGSDPTWEGLQNQPGIVDQAIQRYPILGQIGLRGVETNAKGKYGDIESWQPGESGTIGYERPKELPLDKFGVQVFNEGKTKPIDVLADVVSHNLVKTDPKLNQAYQEFKGSLTDYQKGKLQRDYEYDKKNSGEQRPFDQWAEAVRLPAYFRGYTFNQWPDEWNQNFYSPEQIKNLDQVKNYLGVASFPKPSDYGQQERWNPPTSLGK
jgi:hypothetical protein